jgi:hypothetical protein
MILGFGAGALGTATAVLLVLARGRRPSLPKCAVELRFLWVFGVLRVVVGAVLGLFSAAVLSAFGIDARVAFVLAVAFLVVSIPTIVQDLRNKALCRARWTAWARCSCGALGTGERQRLAG